MKTVLNVSLLSTTILGLLLASPAADAADTPWQQSSNMGNNCQSFEPGVTNTLRNRALGIENIGSASMGIACSFEPQTPVSQDGRPTSYDYLMLWFQNGASVANTISCTLVAGNYWTQSAFIPQSSGSIAAGGGGFVAFNSTSPNWATVQGKYGMSVTCMLPPSVWAVNSHFLYTAGNA